MTTQSHVAPVAEPQPRGVVVGAGGDPLSVGLIFFGIASLALGMSLIGPELDFLPARSQAAIIPILVMGAGLFQIVTTVWAILLDRYGGTIDWLRRQGFDVIEASAVPCQAPVFPW